jgi:hypothetical protein
VKAKVATASSDPGPQPVEILHIDTVNSQEFFRRAGANDSEKCDSQNALEQTFRECCDRYGGEVRRWNGDGGFAYFSLRKGGSGALRAAKDFIGKLSQLASKTATILNRPAERELARRDFRIAAHFCVLERGRDPGNDSDASGEFDAFLKHERLLAPHSNELFVTQQFFNHLPSADKSRFHLHAKKKKFGNLVTSIYRLKSQTHSRAKQFEDGELSWRDIKQSDWDHLIRHTRLRRGSTHSRNQITTSLARIVWEERRPLSGNDVTFHTMRALYNFFCALHPNDQFNLALWRPANEDGTDYLDKVAVYPRPELFVPRRLLLADYRYQMVRSFVSCNVVVTPSVDEARLAGEWLDFDKSQNTPKRALHSAIQLPLYSNKNDIGEPVVRDMCGVLSIDTNKLNFFVQEDLDLWIEDLTGYLANLALGEHMRRLDSRGETNARKARARGGPKGASGNKERRK